MSDDFLSIPGASIDLLLSSRGTGGRFTTFRITTEGGTKLALHKHTYEHGFFFVLAGEYQFEIADKTVTAPAGTSVFVPRETAYSFRQVGSGTAKLLVVSLPGGLDLFFKDVRALKQQGAPLDWMDMAAVLDKHGIRLELEPGALGEL
ncbi:MAG: cupin domain-containing protein [Acidobacteriota bacterium]